jgi:hypothetical protein
MALGGGTSAQKKYNISGFARTGVFPISRLVGCSAQRYARYTVYNDPRVDAPPLPIIAPQRLSILLANGVEFVDKAPDNQGASTLGNSALP